MNRTRLPAAGLAVLLTWLIAPYLYADFPSVRVKIVRGPIAADSARLEIPIESRPVLARLQAPFALIARVRNDAAAPATFSVELDGRVRCTATIAPGDSQRLDCAVRDAWTGEGDHLAAVVGAATPFVVEELELATHHGAIAPGPKDLIVVPSGFEAYQRPSLLRLIPLAILFWIALLSIRWPRSWRLPWLGRAHWVAVSIIGLVLVMTVVAGHVSPYGLVLGDVFLMKLLAVAGLPVLAIGARVATAWLFAPRVAPYTRAAAIGLIVGWAFFAFATDRADRWYRGNTSGLLSIGDRYYDKNPLVNERPDLRDALHLHVEGGYDGQFFYFMAFDPLVTRYAHRPRSYDRIVDFPPYRFGRIGFSWLTWLLSGGRETRFPATMVAITLGSLALCGALLSLLAQRHGLSAWYGALILLIPGFWQSAVLTLPEPLTLAFILAGLLAAKGQRWVLTGIFLGMAMLVRETGGAIVLAVPAAIFLAGHRRAAVTVALLAFTPVVLWKIYLGWIFYPVFGLQAFTPHPDDVGLPFKGVWLMWSAIQEGTLLGNDTHARAGILFAILSTAATALAFVCAVKRPAPMTIAAAFYGLLTILFNYHAVWLNIGNAQRLTIDLFTALALAYLPITGERRLMPRAFLIFWSATMLYMLFGTFDAEDIRRTVFSWTGLT